MRLRLVLAALALALVASVAVACSGDDSNAEGTTDPSTAGGVTSSTELGASGTLFQPPPPAAGFTLTGEDGQPVSLSDFRGEVVALYFGYTHCPDVCPTTMAEMYVWFQTLGDDAADLRAYFVSVDPERDTPEILDQYVSWVSNRITGITGTPEEIDKIRQAWRVVADRVPGSGGDYTINHTASVYLVDSKGQFEGTISYGEDAKSAVEKIRRLVAKG